MTEQIQTSTFMGPSKLVQDNDAHWYLVPAGQEDDFFVWLASMENDMPNKMNMKQYMVDLPKLIIHLAEVVHE